INEYSIYMKLFYTMYPSDILFILLMTFIVISFVFMTVLLERSFRKGKAFLLVGLHGIALIGGYIILGLALSAISNDLSQLHMQFYLGYIVLLTLYVSYKNLRLVQTRLSV
ncbi:MAG TPA: hypothetical protein DCE40_08380, partial [Exiguobacterium sp.]|nr:hypothetical protein [Exiguobacterium sp.]